MRDFGEAPFLVIWEVTRACDLACVHCRASADPLRHPQELT
ncbi:MAG: radical SAM/SPASM domain-containing protein, partial [Acidobacteria bacterium]|nr:radical SAM/SPASM domain-containing protein [Acidobacteriota bacterium]